MLCVKKKKNVDNKKWKQAETMIALAISLTECQEALSEGQFGKQTCDTYFVWSWRLSMKRGIDS